MHSITRSRSARAGLLGLVIAAGLCLATPGIARAQDRQAWRSLSAPTDPTQPLAFVTQQPDTNVNDTGDSSDTPPKGGETKINNNTTPTPTDTKTPTFDKPDTSKMGGFNAAPLETLGPGTTNRNFGGAAATLPVAKHPRRGLLGIHPLAILVALIAVHVFVVTRVVK